MEKDTTQIAIMCTDRQTAKVIASARYGAMLHAGSNEATSLAKSNECVADGQRERCTISLLWR